MKYIFILLLLISTKGFSQYKSFVIGAKGDTLNRVDMKGLKQGPWVIQVPEVRGERGYEEEGYFKDDKKEGTWRRFSLEGDMTAIENYRWGMKDGKSFYYNNVGQPLREESWRAIDPKNAYDTVNVTDPNDPSYILRREIIKNDGQSFRHGTWKYYDPMRGTIESTEQWALNRPLKPQSDDDLAPIDVANADGSAKTEKKEAKKPQAILDYEKKNQKKKVKVRDGSTGG